MCHIKINFWDEKEAQRLFQELLVYNTLIEKPWIKHVKNLDLLQELPSYNELSIVKTSEVFMQEVLKLK